MIEEIICYKVVHSPACFDVMVNGRFCQSLRLRLSAGSYTEDEMKSFAVMAKPSLKGKDFVLIPTSRPVFKS